MSAQPPQGTAPYVPLRLLGQGGMGAVWEAGHEATGQRYALKVVHGAEPEELARFQREARSLAELNHPHVVRLHAARLEGPQPYFVQELLAGGSLAERLRGGPLTGDEARRVAREVAAGVAAAHRAGVLHRDLKPDNVLFSAEGVAKVADFGLARGREAAEQLTRTGAVLGTPAFMAPEQAVDARTADERADVYGLGALLYAMLTGVPPLRTQGRSLIAALTALQTEAPAPPTELNPRAPADLVAVCLRALEKDPALRHPSAAAFAADLAQSSRRRAPAWTWALASAVCLCAALGLLAYLVLREPPRASASQRPPKLPEASPTPPPAVDAARPDPAAPVAGSEAPLEAFTLIPRGPVAVALDGASLLIATPGGLARRVSPWRTELERTAFDLRGFAPFRVGVLGPNAYLVTGLGRRAAAVVDGELAWLEETADAQGLAIRGELVAFARHGGRLTVLRFQAGVAELLASTDEVGGGGRELWDVVWLDDRRLLVAGRDAEGAEHEWRASGQDSGGFVCVVGFDPVEKTLDPSPSERMIGATALAADGAGLVAIGTSGGATLLWRVDEPLRRNRLKPALQIGMDWGGKCGALAFARPGLLVVATSGVTEKARHLVVCDLPGETTRELPLGELDPRSLAVDRDGLRCAVGGERGEVRLASLQEVLDEGRPLD
ncbi:MAG: protein kinase [Planctomycetes bacterium]|nr:protein kinase [Planctomycetota bacterium]